MEKMVKCKACEKEIAKSAKVCPHCGKRVKKKTWVIAVILIGIGVIWAIGDGASGASKGSTNEVQGASNSGGTKAAPVALKIGDTFSTKNLEITVNEAIKFSTVGKDFFISKPAEGGIYVALKWKYKNIGTTPITSFSQPSLKLISPDGVEYSPDLGATSAFYPEAGIDAKFMSDLNPGLTVKDAVVYEIAKDQIAKEGWKIKVEGKDIVLSF